MADLIVKDAAGANKTLRAVDIGAGVLAPAHVLYGPDGRPVQTAQIGTTGRDALSVAGVGFDSTLISCDLQVRHAGWSGTQQSPENILLACVGTASSPDAGVPLRLPTAVRPVTRIWAWIVLSSGNREDVPGEPAPAPSPHDQGINCYIRYGHSYADAGFGQVQISLTPGPGATGVFTDGGLHEGRAVVPLERAYIWVAVNGTATASTTGLARLYLRLLHGR